MKLIAFTTLLLTFNISAANLDMKPGLWEVSMTIEAEGKTIDPIAEMKKTMAKLPKEQQEQMMAMLKKNNAAQICFTKEMIEKPENFKFDEKGKCTHKLLKQTSNKMEMSLNCDDGTSGTAVMDIIKSSEYIMVVNSKGPKGQTAKTTQNGKFLKADCK